MTENLKVFFEQLSQNQALKDELEALGKEYPDNGQLERNKAAIVQKTLEIAAKHGLTLTKEDFEAMEAEAAKAGDLTDEQLEAVAGGGDCSCFLAGFSKGCNCAIVGKSKRDSLSCGCFIAGGGSAK